MLLSNVFIVFTGNISLKYGTGVYLFYAIMMVVQGKLTAKKRVGDIGESIAAEFLTRNGYKIVARNYRKPWGEIDIIAEKSGTIRFVEVKTVSRETLLNVTREMDAHRPEEMVHEAKLRKVTRTAELYMNDHRIDKEFQVDVVCVYLGVRERKARCFLYEQVL